MHEQVDEYLRMVQQKIDEYGWFLQTVLPAQDGPGPSFACTAGLARHQLHPELANIPLHSVEVGDATEHFDVARRLYPVGRGLQVTQPDAGGRFPWETGYGLAAGVQPVPGTP